MRIPYSLQGMFFAPVLIVLIFTLKAFCPGSAGDACFVDWFATPVFLPLVAIYKIFGQIPVANGQEFLFILLYWTLVGLLVGLLIDLIRHKPAPVAPNVAPVAYQTPVASVLPPPTLPSVTVLPIMKTPTLAKKPPMNLLDREEYKN
jgi:hypothetical protein